MKRFRRIGVFLNGSPADDAVLSFGGTIADIAGSEQFHAIYFHEQDASPDKPDPDANAFSDRVAQSIPPRVAQLASCEVHTGTGVREILETARDKDMDLAVVGRRLPHSQLAIGSAFMKLARKAPCDVLVVPEQARAHFARILVPIDFSEHSRVALTLAIELARASAEKNPQVVCQHVFACGYGYRKSGVTLAQAVHAMETNAQQEYDALIRTVDAQGVEVEPIFSVSEQRSEVISDLATARKMDLVLIGSRGRTMPASGLIGATTERILVFSAVPVLVVKQKGETSRFLDAFLS